MMISIYFGYVLIGRDFVHSFQVLICTNILILLDIHGLLNILLTQRGVLYCLASRIKRISSSDGAAGFNQAPITHISDAKHIYKVGGRITKICTLKSKSKRRSSCFEHVWILTNEMSTNKASMRDTLNINAIHIQVLIRLYLKLLFLSNHLESAQNIVDILSTDLSW